ncbi:4'-phosphopantetheinyl transferase family protein [Plebeiibacterium sediminum]|uniref:4'-phosphopantetheinyl transferase superfamily protein n=1 Tax=Plebeiibacterium sediminum TaxID=2992112 RepID=A0AAE3SGM0_9BACT|nr:4'-phosphopantetheinyl transferase superfamily protein [Plebeiobacterium sediminum]MCW3788476.1 4'-phosphopantetheinyl transferase superfamily protein [Plebeiobacterium sediminum]
MPVYLKKEEANGGILAVWEITESVEELLLQLNLSGAEMDRLNSFRLDKRKLEFLATRCLLKALLQKDPVISYLDSGRPVLENSSFNLSISHTKGFAAVALSESEFSGVDIEHPSERVIKVYDRFVSADEKAFIPESQQLQYFTLLWSLKEAMYKIFDEKSVIFNRDLKCYPFKLSEEGDINALFCLNKEVELTYKYITSKDFYLVYHC